MKMDNVRCPDCKTMMDEKGTGTGTWVCPQCGRETSTCG